MLLGPSAMRLSRLSPSINPLRRPLWAPRRWLASVTSATTPSPPPPPSGSHDSTLQGQLLLSHVTPSVKTFMWLRFVVRRLDAVGMVLAKSVCPPGIDFSKSTFLLREGSVLVTYTSQPGSSWGPDDEPKLLVGVQELIDVLPQSGRLRLKPKVFAVRGRPFVDDIKNRFPSAWLEVNVAEADGSLKTTLPLPATEPDALPYATFEEFVFHVLRPYGELHSLEDKSPPPKVPGAAWVQSAKVVGHGTAVVRFDNVHSAAAARLALHGVVLPGGRVLTVKELPYASKLQLRKLLESNTRTVTIAFLALLLFLLATMLKPIRAFLVRRHITESDDPVALTAVESFRNMFNGTISEHHTVRDFLGRIQSVMTAGTRLGSPQPQLNAFTGQDQEALAKFIAAEGRSPLVIFGPSGTGKSELLRQATKGRDNVVMIDVRKILAAKDSAGRVDMLAEQFGFSPGFGFVRLLKTLLSTVGASSLASQVTSDDAEAVATVFSCVQSALTTLDKQLSSSRADVADSKRPLFIISGFREDTRNAHDWDAVLELFGTWAAQATASQLAKVVFVTDLPPFYEEVSQLSPLGMEHIALNDVDESAAKDYVLQRISPVELAEEAATLIPKVGTMLKDVKTYVQKVGAGTPPQAAVDHMVSKAVLNLRGALGIKGDPRSTKWTFDQLWTLLERMHDSPDTTADYDSVLFDIMSGDDDALQKLMRIGLFRTSYVDGLPHTIRPATTIIQAAIHSLFEDARVSHGLTSLACSETSKKLTSKMEALQTQLNVLSCTSGPAVEERRAALLEDLAKLNAKHAANARRAASRRASP